MLRLRTRLEIPEGNLRELRRDGNLKLWDALPAPSQNKGLSNTREELAGCRLVHLPPEPGGRGEGTGANSAPEMASSTKLQTGFHSLTKHFLRFWMVDIRRVAARNQLPRRDTRCT